MPDIQVVWDLPYTLYTGEFYWNSYWKEAIYVIISWEKSSFYKLLQSIYFTSGI